MALVPSTSVGGGSGSSAVTQVYDNVASGAIASWDVTGIAQTYTHLQIVVNARGSDAAGNVNALLRFNNDSGANYDQELLYAQNATAFPAATVGATSLIIGFAPSAGATAGKGGPINLLIPDYTSTTLQKNAVTQNGMSTTELVAGQFTFGGFFNWRSTAAITRVTILPSAGNFVAGSRLSIYGLL